LNLSDPSKPADTSHMPTQVNQPNAFQCLGELQAPKFIGTNADGQPWIDSVLLAFRKLGLEPFLLDKKMCMLPGNINVSIALAAILCKATIKSTTISYISSKHSKNNNCAQLFQCFVTHFKVDSKTANTFNLWSNLFRLTVKNLD